MLKVGLIGCGGVGAFHAECWLRMSEEVQLVAIADVNAENARKYAQKSGAKLYTDGFEMIESEELDVVDLCVPTLLHAEYALFAMKKVRNIIIEKPVCLTEAQAQQLLEEQERTGALVQVAHSLRFNDVYRYVKEVVRSERYGKVISGRFSRISPRPVWMKGHDEKDRTGSMALDMHIHDADFIRYLMDAEPDEINARAAKDMNGIIQHIYATYRFGEALLMAEASWDYPVNMPFCASFRLRLEGAALILDDRGVLTVYQEDGETFVPEFPSKLVVDLGINVSNLSTYLNELSNFVENIKAEEPREIVSLSQAVASFRLVCREIEIAEGRVYEQD